METVSTWERCLQAEYTGDVTTTNLMSEEKQQWHDCKEHPPGLGAKNNKTCHQCSRNCCMHACHTVIALDCFDVVHSAFMRARLRVRA